MDPTINFLNRLRAVERHLDNGEVDGARSGLQAIERDFPVAKYAAREVVGNILKVLDAPDVKASINAAKTELCHRGDSICDVFALERAVEVNEPTVTEWLDSVEIQKTILMSSLPLVSM